MAASGVATPVQVRMASPVAVVMPAFNEAATVGDAVRAFRGAAGPGGVVIVVDDGSTDDTAALAEMAGATVVCHGANRGLATSFRSGLEAALRWGADVVVTADADGQFSAEDVPRLLAPILSGKADVVTGTRFHPSTPNPEIRGLKRHGNRLFTRLTNRISGLRLTDTQCGFRAYSREAALRLTTFGKYTYTQEAILDLIDKGMRVAEVPIRVRPRASGASRLVRSPWSYGVQVMPLVLRSSRDHGPLRFFGGLGVGLGLLGALMLGGVLVHWLQTGYTTPFRSLITIGGGLVLLGAIALMFALLADLLERHRRLSEETLYRLRRLDLEARRP